VGLGLLEVSHDYLSAIQSPERTIPRHALIECYHGCGQHGSCFGTYSSRKGMFAANQQTLLNMQMTPEVAFLFFAPAMK
jgi:hypothetical protein